MSYIPRLIEKDVFDSLKNRKILLLLGSRQVGKTTLINKIISQTGGVLLNMDVEADFARWEAVRSLPPPEAIKNLGAKKILVVDEAQRIKDIGRLIKGWYDSRVAVKIILLGSSSINLLTHAAADLTGRNEKLFLTPLMFSELLPIQNWYLPGLSYHQLAEKFPAQIEALLFQLVIYGNYPEAVTTVEKEKYLINLTSDYLLKDILRGTIVNQPDTIKRLLLLLSYQSGNEVSTSELASSLSISRQTVEHYLDLLEKVFIIFRLPAYSANRRKEIVKSKKIYFWDTGIRNGLQKNFAFPGVRSDLGSLWENWVVAEFAKLNITNGGLADLYFWRTPGGSEVDLIVKKGEKLLAFEIKWSPARMRKLPAFTSQYGIKIQQINRKNFLDILQIFKNSSIR